MKGKITSPSTKIIYVSIIIALVLIIFFLYNKGGDYVNKIIDDRINDVKTEQRHALSGRHTQNANTTNTTNTNTNTTNTTYRANMNNMNKQDIKEKYYDMGMLNRPISNGDYVDTPIRYKNQPWYPNMSLPSQVIGCGGRRQGCLGGTQVGIPTTFPPIDISDRNIAPTTMINLGANNSYNRLHKVGVIQKIFGSENQVYPLFGRKEPYNRNRWEYFTMLGPLSVMVPVIVKHPNDELGTNERVRIEGNSGVYRTIIYDNDFPRYTPNIY